VGQGAPLVWLVRHGQTEWSVSGRHTGRTDVDLTAAGEDQARALSGLLAEVDPDLVLCSPRRRARRTAELAGLDGGRVADDLQEWDYGDLEGKTTPEIRAAIPGWTIWTGPWPDGETAAEVSARADRLIASVRASGAARVVLVGHGHFSRVTAARWVEAPVETGRWLQFDTASWSRLGWDRGTPVVDHWNVPAGR
jgi:broad specificity phosphatase PhoE